MERVNLISSTRLKNQFQLFYFQALLKRDEIFEKHFNVKTLTSNSNEIPKIFVKIEVSETNKWCFISGIEVFFSRFTLVAEIVENLYENHVFLSFINS